MPEGPVSGQPAELLVRGGTLVDEKGSRLADVLVHQGEVVDVGTDLDARPGATVLDADGCVVAPGLVDLHAHLREPGQEESETIVTGARAGSLGGYTAMVAMPNTEPAIDSADAVRSVHDLAEPASAQVAVAAAITVDRAGERLAPMAELGSLGVRLFTDDGAGVQSAALMRRAFEYATGLGVILAQHCEEATLAAGGVMHEGKWSSKLGLPGTPALAEELMVARDLALASQVGARIHFLHLSTREALELVRAARAAGVAVTAEVAPHHFTLTDESVVGYDPLFKVSPPLRPPSDVAAVKEALSDGTVDAIATDHAPHAPELKDLPFDQAPAGMLGLETALSLALGETGLPIERVLALLSWQPAAIAGLDAAHGGEQGGPVCPRGGGQHLRDRSRRHLDGRPGPLGQPQPQHPLCRTTHAGAGAPHRLPGRAGRDRRGGAAVSGTGAAVSVGRGGGGPRPEAALVLADGAHFEGELAGADVPGGIATGEAVFNTVLSGYQEVITDPSYAGQVIAFTYPHIGNYGTCAEDNEAARVHCCGVIVRDLATYPSSWRSEISLEEFLVRRGIPAITGIDTRRLTRHLRAHGAMPCAFGTAGTSELAAAAREAAPTDGRDLVSGVTTAASVIRGSGPYRVVAYDFGVKEAMLRQLAEMATITVVPASTSAATVLEMEPDGIFLSNGPGDPGALPGIVVEVRALLDDGRVPVFGICLGLQLLGAALGAATYKLPFGHHGGNHPVRHLESGRVEITSQNHNYAIDAESLRAAEVTHVNLNDGVVEGIRSADIPAFGVQYHPEAGPGPHDARYLFGEFRSLMKSTGARAAGRR